MYSLVFLYVSELQLLGTVDVVLYSMDNFFFPSLNLANFLICYYSLITPNFHKISALHRLLLVSCERSIRKKRQFLMTCAQ